MNIEERARKIVQGDRQRAYGSPERSQERIAALWGAYLGVPVKSTDVCNMMCLLKLARLKNTPDHEDSKVDLIGYALLHDIITGR